MPPILYLIDGHALAYRTYFALTSAGADRWHNAAGEPTAGIYGFASVLMRIMDQDKPEYMAVAFDTGKTFRDDLFPDYKATREKMPDDLREQINRIREMVDLFNFPRLEVEGYEADDVIGTVAVQAVQQGFGVRIFTGDRDLLQLVSDRIRVNLPGRSISDATDYDIAGVREYMGVMPGQIVDYKALVGDTSDNIPGVKGIGNKTAINLLTTYPSLDAIYDHIDEISGATKTKLVDGREMAYLSQNLARIRLDAPVKLELEKAKVGQHKTGELSDFFKRMEFKSLISKLVTLAGGDQVAEAQPSLFGTPVTAIAVPGQYAPEFVTVDNEKKLAEMVVALKKAGTIAFDTETTSIDPLTGELVGISLAVEEGRAWYIPVGHNTGEPQLDIETVVDAMKPIFGDASKALVGHNLKYDAQMLGNYGIHCANLAFDTMIAEWLIDPASRSMGLKDMAERYLNIEMTHIEALIGKGKNQLSMADVPVEKVAPYAAADAEVTFKLMPLLAEKVEAQNEMQLFREIEMPLVSVLARMERLGIAVDEQVFAKMGLELEKRLADLEREIIRAVGYPFNINSTQQLSKALFNDLKLPPPDKRYKNASGHYSTAAEVLEMIRHEHECVEWLLEYRELTKLKSTYIDTLPQQISQKDGRIHTNYNQIGSVTGRLASTNPNLQNIPTRTEQGRLVRQGFVSEPGKVLLSVDYSQIELRVVASMSGDTAMLEAFEAGQDIHAATAALINGIPLEQVTKDQRRSAKAINFGIIYGMSAFGLSNSTSLTLAEAENFVKAYYEKFPGVKSYLDGIRKQAAEQGYVETMLGRKRFFPNLQKQIPYMVRSREEREAINAPIQGTAADIIKISMIRMQDALNKAGLNAKMVLQVHDELIFEVPGDEVDRTIPVVREVMEKAFKLPIPLETEARTGLNWAEMTTVS